MDIDLIDQDHAFGDDPLLAVLGIQEVDKVVGRGFQVPQDIDRQGQEATIAIADLETVTSAPPTL